MTITLASWISAGIIFASTTAFTLYFNYRLDRLIKMLDSMIVERPD